ncbi:lantibiotic dehydratase [Streptomyces sp. NPDC008001]|uniref:lantibiotic dehydratase n=1 Tax=Streptomyces sp. NPDC008001 TaxID=3364804 RepID=UPI0036E17A71
MGSNGAKRIITAHRRDGAPPGREERAWSLVPVALLRHAGFPVSLLRHLADPAAADGADAVIACYDAVRSLAQQVKAELRGARAGREGDLASGVGMMRPFPEEALAQLGACLSAPAMQVIERYQSAALLLDRTWRAFEEGFPARLGGTRRHVAGLFRDPALKQVLLLSNDARFAEFAAWLDGGSGGSDGHVRRMTDLLAMYLQRVATKNETHSHFGPLSVARLAPDADGVSWTERPLRRIAFLSHWAGERLAEVFSRRPEVFEHVRPRRRPLAFADGADISLYAFETTTGMPGDWRFVAVTTGRLDPGRLWLWERCDGEHTVAQLRAAWAARAPERTPAPARDQDSSFDAALNELIAEDWLVGRWEIPIGSADPLSVLESHLLRVPGGGSSDLATVHRLRTGLREFAEAPGDERAPRLAEMKETFEKITGTAANRADGMHYADRSIFYEEAYSPVAGLRFGRDVADLISRELSLVYETALLAPRLRIRREQDILRRWVEQRFGPGVPVPLQHFYAGFYADKPALARACEDVDRELAALDRELTALLLQGHTEHTEDTGHTGHAGGTGRVGGGHEVLVERDRLEELLDRYPAAPPALCNPDVMIAAPDTAAIARGDFLAVVGDCHAVREVLTHSSFAPLIEAEAPEVLAEVHSRYLSLLDEDEELVDLARSHPDKTGAQLLYPCPDLEVYGLSPKSRDRVLQPRQLYVTARDGRIELRAHGTGKRLKLLAPLAGGPSIRQDPLSPFAFPRHFGGIGLRGVDHDHLPRIRCGRVVLHRERWRIPARAFRGWSPGIHRANGDAAEFTAGRRLRRGLGLPETGFAKVPGEPKPVYVDWGSPLLVRQLFRLARRSGGTGSPVEFTEMLPSQDQLWLDIGGQRHTSELRCAVFSRGRS